MSRSGLKGKIIALSIALCSVLVSTLFTSAPVGASSKETVLQKAEAYGLYQCYAKSAFSTEISLSDYNSTTTIVSNAGAFSLNLPNDYVSGITSVNCQELLSGTYNRRFQGMYAQKGGGTPPATSAAPEAKASFLQGMGYSADNNGANTSEKCSTVSYFASKYDNRGGSTPLGQVKTRFCAAGGGSTIGTSNISVTTIADTDGVSGFLAVKTGTNYIELKKQFQYNAKWERFDFSPDDNWHDFIHSTIWNFLSSGNPDGANTATATAYSLDTTTGFVDDNNASSTSKSYSYTNFRTAASAAIGYLTNNAIPYTAAARFGDDDKVMMLQSYLNDYYGMEVKGCGLTGDTASAAVNQGYVSARIYRDGSYQQCHVKASKNESKSVYIYNSDGYYDGSSSTDFNGVITTLNGLSTTTNPGDISGGGGVSGGNNDGTVDAGEASTISPCYEGSGALGWIICPVLEAVGAATEWMYDNAIEPLLQIRADTLFSGTDGIYVGWSTFRNFSNILFAIAFAVIILAQVTGIGISNYNIKKILPRFVVVVVLVNISYILCQLAVDVSNILGFSIRELFDRLPVPGVKATGGEMVVAILNGLGLAAGVGVGVNAALSSVVVVSTLKYFMVPLVLAFVGCLLGVLFFFITMSVRQTGIVILVVLAPVAIVCYALPNTKSLFDKWRKLFTALLMVYPICGLLMGGGNYVSALLLGAISGSQEGMGTLYTITALLVSILPFFLIPSLVKGSMAMIGNLGMKISNFGNGISRGLKSGVMNSRAVQERQAEQKRRLSIAQDQTKRNRIQGRVSENSFRNRARALIGRAPRTELTNREATRLARAQAGINRATSETSAALEQTWANDGTSNDFDAMKNILLTSAEAYAKDENNFEALERMNAAMRTLSGTEPGQDVIYSTFNQMEANAAQNLDEKGRIKTQRALRKMSNDLMAMSGDKIKKDAPILMRKMKNYQKMETNGNINTSYLYDNRSATGGLADLKEVASSTADLSPATMPGVNESTLQTYIDAISSGKFDRGSTEYNNVTTAARRALTDPHIKGQVKGKVATLLQQLANMDYVGTASGTAAATGSVARASEAELSRIQSGLRDMRERPDATSEPHRQQMLNTLEQTMLRGTVSNDGDEFSLSPSNATQIDKILKENGINVTERFQSGVYDVDGSPVRNMSPDQFNQRYESMMGLKIDHSDRPASSSNLGSDSTSQTQTQPERPIIQADGDQSMERIREIARENPGPRQRNSQSGPRRNGQNGNIGNNDNPPTIFT